MEVDLQERVLIAISNMITSPESADIKKLKGKTDTYRLRVGDYRVIYLMIRKDLKIFIQHIKHRKEVYK